MMTSFGSRCVLFLLLFAFPLLGQTRPLNPTVRVLPRPAAPVPDECEEGVAPQIAQRVERAEIAPERDTTRDLKPPPSRDLRSSLQAAQEAAERNDRDSFLAALESAKSLLASYPPGGEQTAARDAIAVYDDLSRLWEYQFNSPMGAFFSAATENGALLSMLTKYRGYEGFIRPQLVTDSTGTQFYPTRESREFLAREAASRLTRLGFPAPPAPRRPASAVTRQTPAPAPAVTAPPPRPPVRRETVTPRTKASGGRTTSAAKSSRRSRPGLASKPASRPAAARAPQTVSRPRSEPPPATATVEEVPLPPPVVSTTAASAGPEAPSPRTARTETTPSVPIETVDTAGTVTDTTSTVTDTTTAAAPKPAGRSRGVILPLLLILLGAGVLILLFRASS